MNSTNAPDKRMTARDIAGICYEANRAYCRAIHDPVSAPWELALVGDEQSCINGVFFHMDNPGANPAQSHANWLREKEAAGWRYGPAKDVDRKEHPCFAPYEELPASQRIKDSIFKTICDVFRPYFIDTRGTYMGDNIVAKGAP